MHIETVFLDIDGTVFFDRKIVASAKEAVQQLQAKDYTVVICTGRSVLHARPIQAQFNIHHSVCFNGGLTQLHGQVIDAHPLNEDVVQRMVDFTDNNHLPLILHTTDEALAINQVPQVYNPILRAYDFPPIRQIASVTDSEPIFQANVMMKRKFDERAMAHFPECLLYRWHDEAVDLQKGGCDKSVGALALLHELGRTTETALHVGDGGNDIGMFQKMGMSIAMGNAPEDVKEHAQMVTDRADEDGVFNAFRKLQLI